MKNKFKQTIFGHVYDYVQLTKQKTSTKCNSLCIHASFPPIMFDLGRGCNLKCN